ncbi:serine hydrolase domain-containing protein [Luedemannella flava]|uniref:Serine hydrolase domain-containing protein n=1 Tax=Luedemannella flava TaxID=349316 RepID=A0ABN2LPY7_9ACTN
MSEQWNDLAATVRTTIDKLVASGDEAGVQVAAYLDGEPIIDAVAGVADARSGRLLTADTPIFSFSVGKGLLATVVHVLAERHQLDYDLRIADVWPEYARHGKGATTLRHALTHAAGVPALPADIRPEDFADWDRMCAIIADARPEWEPGTAHGYHAWTYGWLVGETVRRTTGRRVSDVLATEIAAPLGVPGELLFGVPDDQLDRVAHLDERNWSAALEAMAGQLPHLDRVAPPGVRPDAAIGNNRDVLGADVPAVGTVTARAAARLFAALIGEVDGVRLLPPDRLRTATAPVTTGPDWVFGQPGHTGLGYDIGGGRTARGGRRSGIWFGASGSGGSLAYGFPELGLSVAATKNRMAFSPADDPMEDLRALIQAAVTKRRGAS